jgi:quinoprotein glucose dehydrogenase
MPDCRSRLLRASAVLLAVAALVLLTGRVHGTLLGESTAAAPNGGSTLGEWPTYGGDLGSKRYAPLDQITRDNFNKLEVAWRFKTDNFGPRPEFRFEATPLMVNGTVYSVAGSRRSIVALDAVTGELRWVYGLDEGKRAEVSPRKLSGRGLSYWTDGRDERVVYVTAGYQLVALDAKIGRPIASFGKNGIVDLKLENDQLIDPLNPDVGLHSPPLVVGDVVVVGAAHKEGGVPKSKMNVKGYVRGYDIRTGKRLWIFHTIAQPGEFGNETWEKDSWSYTGNTGVWGPISADAELGLVYLPIEEPTGDYYGGHRPGNNLFSESLVAVDVKTGVRKWHYQFVHHPIWDLDIPCAPIVADIVVNGRAIKAIAQPTKQSLLYVFDRVTGQPVWPIEERPVEKGTVPSEWYAPTQPFPTKPPAFGRNGVAIDDLIDFTPALRAEAVAAVSKYKLGPLFTPPVVRNMDGPITTLFANSGGGANWPGGSYDPETHTIYVGSQHNITGLSLVRPGADVSDMEFVAGGNQALRTEPPPPPPAPQIQGLPLGKPPYGRISAIDLDKGEMRWQVAHGDTPDAVKNHPMLKGLSIPRTGRPGAVGTLVTKTLLIAGESSFNTTASGARGALLRAYDKATGADAGAVYMPAPQTGSPMSYMVNGQQYIIVAISGANYSGELLAFRLPR